MVRPRFTQTTRLCLAAREAVSKQLLMACYCWPCAGNAKARSSQRTPNGPARAVHEGVRRQALSLSKMPAQRATKWGPIRTGLIPALSSEMATQGSKAEAQAGPPVGLRSR